MLRRTIVICIALLLILSGCRSSKAVPTPTKTPKVRAVAVTFAPVSTTAAPVPSATNIPPTLEPTTTTPPTEAPQPTAIPEPPTEVPASAATQPPAPAAAGITCDRCIKGNINSKGDMIYHYPGCRDYERTVIDESKGERWFSSEAEAQAAGWRVALNCR